MKTSGGGRIEKPFRNLQNEVLIKGCKFSCDTLALMQWNGQSGAPHWQIWVSIETNSLCSAEIEPTTSSINFATEHAVGGVQNIDAQKH